MYQTKQDQCAYFVIHVVVVVVDGRALAPPQLGLVLRGPGAAVAAAVSPLVAVATLSASTATTVPGVAMTTST